jgi:hypothetical protein
VRDSALLGLDACAGRNNAGIDAHTIVAQAQNAIVRSVRRDTLVFRRHLEKVAPQHSASFLVRRRFGVARGRLWRKAALRNCGLGKSCSGRTRQGPEELAANRNGPALIIGSAPLFRCFVVRPRRSSSCPPGVLLQSLVHYPRIPGNGQARSSDGEMLLRIDPARV